MTWLVLTAALAALPDGGPDEVPETSIEADAGVPVEAEPPPAVPETSYDPPPPAEAPKTVEATGYVNLRGIASRSRVGGLIPTDDQPQFQGLLELNGQVRVNLAARSFISSDVSLVGQVAGSYHGTNAEGAEVDVGPRTTAAGLPFVSINELYLLHELHPALNVLVGKKRLVWGSGFAFNPTDLLNLRKDPTDPTAQRTGAWMARVEVPLETFTFSFVFAPSVMRQAAGIPYQFLVDPPGTAGSDGQLHYQLMLRAYALLFDADLNLMLLFGNQYNDAFTEKPRLGLSFSRYFFTDYELHLEALFQTGSARDLVNEACVESPTTALECGVLGTPFLEKRQLNDGVLRPRILVGGRRMFADESLLSLEYYWQADGYTPQQLQALVNGLEIAKRAVAMGVPADRVPSFGAPPATDGVPQRFAFEPLGRHYLFASYMKPRIFDDFTAQLVLIASLQDLSTIFTPSVAWSATEWLTLTVLGFFPVPGPDALAATRPGSGGEKVSEYTLLPMRYRVFVEARVFY